MPTRSANSPTVATRLERMFPFRSVPDRRATLRDLYLSGLVSIFRRDSVLRVWEPLRETPRRSHEDVSR